MGIANFRELLLKLSRESDVTILISSHILEELGNSATNYCFIDKGKIIEEISAKDIEERGRRCVIIKVNDTNRKKASI